MKCPTCFMPGLDFRHDFTYSCLRCNGRFTMNFILEVLKNSCEGHLSEPDDPVLRAQFLKDAREMFLK